MVKVYFETPNHSAADLVAVFDTEDLYDACRSTLAGLAREEGLVLTENIEGEGIILKEEDNGQ